METRNGLDHYVELPRYMFIIRIVQGALAVILLGLVCYPTHVWTTAITNAPDALAFNIFTPVWTFLVLAYAFAIPLTVPRFWNKWAALALEFITWVFWLTAFAIMADFVRKSSIYGKYNYSGAIYRRSLEKRQSGFDDIDLGSLFDDISSSFGGNSGGGFNVVKSGVTPWWALCAVCTAIGAVGWVLWSFSLYTFAMAIKNQSSTPAPEQSEAEKYGKTDDVEMNTQSVGTAPQ